MSVVNGRRVIGASLVLMLILLFPAVAHAAVPAVAVYSPCNVSVGSSSPVYVLVHDSGVPRAGASVTASAAGEGTVTPVTAVTNASGYASFTLNSRTTPGLVTITASCGGAQATGYTGVDPGRPTNLTMITPSGLLPANGYCVYNIAGKATDRYGNGCKGWPVNVTLDGTDLRIAYAGPDGTYSYDLGPRSSKQTYNIAVEANGIIMRTSARFMEANLYLTGYQYSVPAGQNVSITATLLDDLAVAPGILLSFTVYSPNDQATPSSYSAYTDQNGRVTFTFTTSPAAGNNIVYVGNQSLGGDLQYAMVRGRGGDVSQIILASSPAQVLADGSTHGILKIWAKDSGGNPVKSEDLTVVRNYFESYPVMTNSNGYAEIDAGPSSYVGIVHYDVTDANGVTSGFNMTYIAGPPAMTVIKAEPNVIASSDVSQPEGMSADIHTTRITAEVTDQWSHPLPGYTISVISLNTTAGRILAPVSGTTDANGEFNTNFSLGNYSMGTGTVEVQALSGVLSSSRYPIIYTNNSFLSVDTNIRPRNVSVNGTMSVTVTIQGLGWNNRAVPVDMMLITDRSGSMDWYSTVVGPNGYGGAPKTGTMADDGHAHLVGTYYNSQYSNLMFMVSSPYTNFGGGHGSFYHNMYVVGPDNRPNCNGNYTYTGYPSESYSNENYVNISGAETGAYSVYAYFEYDSNYGKPPYSFAVLTSPKRLGRGWLDNDSAAKVAATMLINKMTDDNQMGLVSFSDNAKLDAPLSAVSGDSKLYLTNAINSLNANGATYPYKAIQIARDEFTTRGCSDAKQIIILLSDGYSYSVTQDLAQADAAKNENIVIYTIGMGMADADTLKQIAAKTGGVYYNVSSSQELADRYLQIYKNVTDVVAKQSTMDIISARTVVNGTLTNDTEYVPHTAKVTFTNLSTAWIEPNITYTSDGYTLTWEPGEIKTNDIWALNYQLKAMHGGQITPITNKSVIRSYANNNTTSFYFAGDSLFCQDNDTGHIGATSPGLQVRIITPANNTTTDKLRLMVGWQVLYNWTDTYTQRVSILPAGTNDWLDIARGFTGDRNSPGDYSYTWNLDRVPTGKYTIQVFVTDGTYDAQNETMISIPYNSGEIELK